MAQRAAHRRRAGQLHGKAGRKRRPGGLYPHPHPPYRLRRFLLGESAETNRLETFLDEVADQADYGCWYFGRYHLDRAVSPKAVAVYRKIVPLWTEPKKRLFRRGDGQAQAVL